MAVIEEYQCKCVTPRPRLEHGQESGLCEACTSIYDEGLYEMRCRQYNVNWHYPSVHDFLLDVDPKYRELAGLPR